MQGHQHDKDVKRPHLEKQALLIITYSLATVAHVKILGGCPVSGQGSCVTSTEFLSNKDGRTSWKHPWQAQQTCPSLCSTCSAMPTAEADCKAASGLPTLTSKSEPQQQEWVQKSTKSHYFKQMSTTCTHPSLAHILDDQAQKEMPAQQVRKSELRVRHLWNEACASAHAPTAAEIMPRLM